MKTSFIKKNLFFTYFALLFCLLSCAQKIDSLKGTVQENSPEAQSKPYVVLISLDGFRWDYVERFSPPNIKQFIKNGAQATSMIPTYPSKTFPNHYSIATGMYPNKHGLLDNSYFNYNKKAVYKIRDREKIEDGSWYKGTPLWVLAAKEKMMSASYFFVGSEADVQGIRPSYYHKYDGGVSNKKRIETLYKWLKLPAKHRPHFITMYFSDMDDIGHKAGPNNDLKLKEALLKLDNDLGELFKKVKKTKLAVNIILVSDHGMYEIPISKYIPIESIENEENYQVVSNGAIAHIYVKDTSKIEDIIQSIEEKATNYKVYKTKETPYFDVSPTDKNWGSIQVVPDQGWYFSKHRSIALKKKMGLNINGEHGLPTSLKEMHAIFYANGPHIKKGASVGAFKNIHVYPFVCNILGLNIPDNIDGDSRVLEELLIK